MEKISSKQLMLKASGFWDEAWAGAKAVPGGLWQGVKNVGRGAAGLAETAAGGIGTGLAAGAGGIEAATDAIGLTDDTTNVGFDTAKTMADFARAGVENVGDVYGAGGAAGLRGDRGNHVTKLHEQVMDEAGYGDTAKFLSRGALGTGRLAAEGATYIAGPGLLAAGGRGAIAGARGATGVARIPGTLAGLTQGGAAHVGNATKFTSVPQALKTLWSPAGKRVAGVAAGAAGIESGVEMASSAMKAYREPWLPADMREILGPVKARSVEKQLRESAINYAKDYFTPTLLRNEPLNAFDKAVGDAAWSYGKDRALNELKQSWGRSGAKLPTGPHVAALAGKRFLASRLPKAQPNPFDVLQEGANSRVPLPFKQRAQLAHIRQRLAQYINAAGQAGSDIGSSNIAGGVVDVGRTAAPESLPEAGGMAGRTGGVAGRRIAEKIPTRQELMQAYMDRTTRR